MRSEAKKFRTVASLIVMLLSGAAGFFIDLIDAKPFISPHKCL